MHWFNAQGKVYYFRRNGVLTRRRIKSSVSIMVENLMKIDGAENKNLAPLRLIDNPSKPSVQDRASFANRWLRARLTRMLRLHLK